MHERLHSDPGAALLKAQIEASKTSILASTDPTEKSQDGFLMLASPQEALPKLAFMDPVLTPLEKVLWANIWIHAKEQGAQLTGFPSNKTLMVRCNVRRRSAIGRSIAVLRLCRWISLCEKVTDPSTGEIRGNLYALHDEPATLSLTKELDDTYMEFLERCLHNSDSRIRDVARRVSATIDLELQQGRDPLQHDPLDQQHRRLVALRNLEAMERTESVQGKSFFAALIGPLANDHVQNPHLVFFDEKTEKSPCAKSVLGELPSAKSAHGRLPRSSSNKKTTTTNIGAENKKNRRDSLVRPTELSDNEYRLVLRRIERFPLKDQQDLLDELGEQIRQRKNTHNPIRNPVGYLNWLCDQIEHGKQPLSSAHLERQKRRQREAELQAAERKTAERAMAEMEALARKAKIAREGSNG